jgi:PTS system nitrogen regulatory IIA component
MQIRDLLAPERVVNELAASSRKRALEMISELVANNNDQGLTQADIFTSLIGREKLGSTGIGHGVALPHARIAGTEQAMGVFAKLPEAIEFDAIDNQPVDMMFALMVPENSADEHLQILAQLAQMFSNADFCSQLREAKDSIGLIKLFNDWQPD